MQSLLVVWICTSWVAGDVGHLSCASWPFRYLILKMSLQIICLSLNPVLWVVGSCVFWALSTCWVDSLPSHSGLFAPLVPLLPRFLFESEVMLFIIYCFLLPAFLGVISKSFLEFFFSSFIVTYLFVLTLYLTPLCIRSNIFLVKSQVSLYEGFCNLFIATLRIPLYFLLVDLCFSGLIFKSVIHCELSCN